MCRAIKGNVGWMGAPPTWFGIIHVTGGRLGVGCKGQTAVPHLVVMLNGISHPSRRYNSVDVRCAKVCRCGAVYAII